jgi:hypothetical protein
MEKDQYVTEQTVKLKEIRNQVVIMEEKLEGEEDVEITSNSLPTTFQSFITSLEVANKNDT